MPPSLPDMPSILPAPSGPAARRRAAPGPVRLAAGTSPAPTNTSAGPARLPGASSTVTAPRLNAGFAPAPWHTPAMHQPARSRVALARRAARPLALPALAGLLALAGCNSDPNRFPPTCPATAILADAADLTRFDGRGQDLTDMVIDGKITGLAGRCRENGDGRSLQTTVTVSLDLSRGPAARSRTEPVGYFVAVTRGDTILDKRTFELRVAFPPNTDLVHVSGEPVQLALPTPTGVTGATYRILIGFQLSPEELALNRRRGVR